MKQFLAAVPLVFALAPLADARADQPIDLLHVQCDSDPAIHHFSVEVEPSGDLASYASKSEKVGAKATAKERTAKLMSYGLISPVPSFDYECNFEGNRYEISGNHEIVPPKCSGDSRIRMTFKRDGDTLVDNAYFSPACESEFGGPSTYLSKIIVDDNTTKNADYNRGHVTLVISESGKFRLAKNRPIYLEPAMPHPITQQYINCLEQNAFFEPDEYRPAIETCNKSWPDNAYYEVHDPHPAADTPTKR